MSNREQDSPRSDSDGDFVDVNDNRRQAARTPTKLEGTVVLLGVTGMPRFSVLIRETSRSGLSFVARRGFRVGEPIAIELVFVNRRGKLVLARVKHSVATGGVSRVGVEFVEAVSIAREGKTAPPRKWVMMAEAWLRAQRRE